MNEFDLFFDRQPEPVKSCLLALKDIILATDKNIIPAWKYGMPFFCFDKKMICYLWIHKKLNQPYLGIVEGMKFDEPDLLTEKRSRMKIMLFDPVVDLPKKKLNALLDKMIQLYR